MAPISYLNRAKIISLIEMDVSEARVTTQLGLPKSSVNFIVRRWRESGLFERKAGSRRPRTSTEEEDQTLVHVIENRHFLPAVDALGLTNFPASVHTARRRIRAANLRNHSAARKFRVKPRHKETRVGFALNYILREDNFWEHVIFTDEKVFQSSSSGRLRVYRPRNQRYNEKYVRKIDTSGRFSVNLWAWISANSRGVLLQVEERLTSHVYIRVLEDVMLASVTQVFPENDFITRQLSYTHRSQGSRLVPKP
jgi:hypothetical protein